MKLVVYKRIGCPGCDFYDERCSDLVRDLCSALGIEVRERVAKAPEDAQRFRDTDGVELKNFPGFALFNRDQVSEFDPEGDSLKTKDLVYWIVTHGIKGR